MNSSINLLLSWLALIIVLLSGCGAKAPQHNKWAGGLIIKEGVYNTRHSETIHVKANNAGIVQFKIADSAGNIVGETAKRASAYQRWFLFWDEQKRLWFWSSDVGGSLLMPDRDGRFKEVSINEDTFWIKEMPRPFFEQLPGSMKARWQSVRN
ncbi:MAG: hypothetical protein ACO1QB_13700 [Verrucomicrobiales bacterium]